MVVRRKAVAPSCQLHGYHSPKPLVIVKHHVVPLSCGGPDLASNWLMVCDTGHRNLHTLMGPIFNGLPMPTGGTGKERATARLALQRWIELGKPGDPHGAYGLAPHPPAGGG